MVLTQEVSLGVISLQGRQSPTYNEHIPMNELYTMMKPAYLGKFPTFMASLLIVLHLFIWRTLEGKYYNPISYAYKTLTQSFE